MSLVGRINQIVRQVTNETYRIPVNNVTSNTNNTPVIVKVLSTIDSQYVVLLPSGETRTVTATGNRPIAINGVYHLIGSTIF